MFLHPHLHLPTHRAKGETTDMTTGSPTRGIVTFALPLVVGYVLQQMYLLINAVICGRWLGVGALAAVGASTSVMFLVMGFCNGCCAGIAIPIAQAFGAKRMGLMRSYVANAVRIALGISFLLTVATACLTTPILRAINTPRDIFSDAYIFLLLSFLTIPCTMAYNLLAGFMRAVGNSRHPFYFLIAASLLNIVLDLLFIVLLGWGVAGAGIATWLAQAFAAGCCWLFIRRRMLLLIPQGEERVFLPSRARTLFNNGVPMGLQFSITGIGIIMLQSANNALGTAYVAAFTASMRVKYLFTCVFENLGVAMATYCGQNIGARRLDRVSLGVRSALWIDAVYVVCVFAVVYPLAPALMQLFVKDPAIVAHAAQFMRVACFFYPALAVLTLMRYSIQGLGYSNLSMLSGVMEMLARCGVSLFLVPALAWTGVCFGDPVAWLAADCFLVPCYLLLFRHLARKQK